MGNDGEAAAWKLVMSVVPLVRVRGGGATLRLVLGGHSW